MVGGKENFMNIWPIDLIDGEQKPGLTRAKAIKIMKAAQEREMQRRALQSKN